MTANLAQMRMLDSDDIQLLRYWRNLDHVRSRMVLGKLITRDEQRVWFDSLDPSSQHYFIYSLNGIDIGSVNLSNINIRGKSFEGGLLCGNQEYLGHWINVWAYLQVLNMAFGELKLEVAFARVLNDNSGAINLNSSLGYKFLSSIEPNASWYRLSKKNYEDSARGLQKLASRFKPEQA